MQWIYATVSTAAVVTGTEVFSGNRKYLIVHNPSKTAYLAFTLDGTTPAIEGAGITLFPGGTHTSDQFTQNGLIKAISDGTSKITIGWR